MLKGKSFLDYTNLFSPNDYEKDHKIILKYFWQLKRWKIYIVLFVASIENLKNLKYTSYKKTLVLSIICSKCRNEEDKIFKEEKSIEILKTLGLIENI